MFVKYYFSEALPGLFRTILLNFIPCYEYVDAIGRKHIKQAKGISIKVLLKIEIGQISEKRLTAKCFFQLD